MSLFLRLLRFLALSAFNLLIRLIAVLIRFILLPILQATLRVLLALIFTSFAATVNGPRQFIDRLASEWTRRIIELVDGRDHIDQIFSFCRLMAGTMIVLGWLVSILFTVAILRVVSSFFI